LKDKTHVLFLLIAAVVYSVTAYFSVGYYHADEQYQIIEFANARIENIPSAGLTWEYEAQIRSSLQPAIAELFLRACRSVSISNPYTQTFLLRLFTAWISLLVLYRFVSVLLIEVDKRWRLSFLFLSYFLWFFPFLFVRFSSETFSALILVVATTMLLNKISKPRQLIIIGCLFGLAFLFRFQTAIASAGILAWMLVVGKMNWKDFLILSLSGISVLCLGMALDSWYYGKFVCTPWNYFTVNIVEDVAANYGVTPWYMYFYYILKSTFWPVGVLIILSLGWFVTKHWKHPFAWIALPFLVMHVLIGHKELRFLIPIVFILPFVLVQFFEWISGRLGILGSKKSLSVFLFGLAIVNVFALSIAMIKPAGKGFMAITAYISEMKEDAFVLCLPESNPYDPWQGTISHFYLEENVKYLQLQSESELFTTETGSHQNVYIAMRLKYTTSPEVQSFLSKNGFVYCTQSIPSFFEWPMKIYGAYPWKDVLILYKKSPLTLL
jgi:phosphatidylinositol glycan class B